MLDLTLLWHFACRALLRCHHLVPLSQRSAALDLDNAFAITWDLRKLVPPSLSALRYGQTWQTENAADIERLGESITVLVSSPVTRVCANLCTGVCNPPQPLRICSSTEEAISFAADVHRQRATT